MILLNIMLNDAQLAKAQSSPYATEAGRSNDAAFEARIQVLSRPIGAEVALDGEYSMVGRTPYTISHFLRGSYRIRAAKPGYETWEADYVFNGRGDDKLSIKLTPKSRYKALWRSMLVPGWGQAYSDHQTRGAIIGLMQLGAAGVLFYQDSKYSEALNDYNAALKNFQTNQKDQEGQADLIAQVGARRAVLDNAYETRQRWLIVTGLIYAYNVADALLFFPSYRDRALELGLTLDRKPELRSSAVKLNLNANF
ncbi:MAG: DUF5683 domain-containing protein [candidate division KSB1 bacterium]|nr:DUF5683 domain-containing protein [candidate division KSB1 bacterium]MDZ7405940.1 DUF5683 domain-containing protein [candidate division KSB1 bacterium]